MPDTIHLCQAFFSQINLNLTVKNKIDYQQNNSPHNV